MIDVAVTGQYDVCLFNSAAQVFLVRSGHGNPLEWLCVSGLLDDLNSQGYACLERYQQSL